MTAKPFTLKCRDRNAIVRCVIYGKEFLISYKLFINNRKMRRMSEIYSDLAKKGPCDN